MPIGRQEVAILQRWASVEHHQRKLFYQQTREHLKANILDANGPICMKIGSNERNAVKPAAADI